MNKKEITYENGKITAYGKELSMLGDMYCLNDLFEAMDKKGIKRQQLGQYVRTKSFIRLIENITGISIGNITYIISFLCRKGLISRVGRWHEKRIYVKWPILWCILTDYNDTLTKDASDLLVLKREFNSVG